MRNVEVTWMYVGEELGLYWKNPWDGSTEKIATFWWPTHPPEDTAEVERMFEEIAQKACKFSVPVSDELLKSRLGPTVVEQLEASETTQPGDHKDG